MHEILTSKSLPMSCVTDILKLSRQRIYAIEKTDANNRLIRCNGRQFLTVSVMQEHFQRLCNSYGIRMDIEMLYDLSDSRQSHDAMFDVNRALFILDVVTQHYKESSVKLHPYFFMRWLTIASQVLSATYPSNHDIYERDDVNDAYKEVIISMYEASRKHDKALLIYHELPSFKPIAFINILNIDNVKNTPLINSLSEAVKCDSVVIALRHLMRVLLTEGLKFNDKLNHEIELSKRFDLKPPEALSSHDMEALATEVTVVLFDLEISHEC